uniref:hypothetical protein n=1 Tax=Trichocoleus desertorum TaxID=1481672 RepID=UPI0025B57E61|nr:hypothetical protein [Trichocoleus desertorum]
MKEFLDAFKKQLEENWLVDFKKSSKVEDLICEDPNFQDFHQQMGEINTPEDYWNFYLRIKRDKTLAGSNSLTVFQRAKATQFFIFYCGDPVIHWFFVQAIDALEHNLYIPACSAILNGIEASLRITIHQVEKSNDISKLSPYQVLSNPLILKAKDLGLPVHALALPNETDFKSKLATNKPNRIDVEIVRIRNNICHGNLVEYIDTSSGKEYTVLTPECLQDLAFDLVDVSRLWAYSLGMFRIEKILHNQLRFLVKQNIQKAQ